MGLLSSVVVHSECFMMTIEERQQVLKIVSRIVKQRVPLIAHVGAISFFEVKKLIECVAEESYQPYRLLHHFITRLPSKKLYNIIKILQRFLRYRFFYTIFQLQPESVFHIKSYLS